ncbi:MAG: T9SS type A sorting domain-containing protein [Croceimicrobium sp.]
MLAKRFILLVILSISFPIGAQTIHYVNHAATGSNDGSSWANAFTDLQSALSLGLSGEEVWVAQGTYIPSLDTSGVVPTDKRACTFRLKPGLRIYGGFQGNESQKSQRDWRKYPSILSGEQGLANQDNDNSAHVVTAFDAGNEHLKLDGFSIIKGYAELFNWPLGYTSTFLSTGSAIYIIGEVKAIFQNIIVSRNYAIFAQIYIEGSTTPGGSYLDDVHLVNLRGFADNGSYRGEFLYMKDARVQLLNCLIDEPITSLYNYTVRVQRDGVLKVRNTAIVGDTAWLPLNGAFKADQADTLSVNNSICTGHTADFSNPAMSSRNIIFPSTAGVWDSAFYVNSLPRPASMPYLIYPNTNYRPRPDFFGVDKGDTIFLPFDRLDFDEDGDTTERIDFDIDMNPRVFGANVDIGPYEYQQSFQDTSHAEICLGDSIFWENNWRSGSKNFSSIFHRGAAGDSVMRLFLRHDSINTGITPSNWGDYFTSDEADSGSTYQWIDCFFKDSIIGANDRVFQPTQNGRYQVIITNRTGCVDTSECVNLPNISLEELNGRSTFRLFPNPANEWLQLDLDAAWLGVDLHYAIANSNGQVLLRGQLYPPDHLEIDISQLPAGLYFIRLNGQALQVFVKS